MIENEIFKKSKIIYDKLISYGFKKDKEKYIFKKNILNDSFRVEVEINNKDIKGKVYDLSFNEEYTNFRLENQTGEFTRTIKEEFENILIDIRNKCTTLNYFVSNQANRITNYIINKYHDEPYFAWEKSPGNGIFKNPTNGKWYGLIMNINKNKLDDENKEVEVINVKLDENEIKNLLKQKGYYKAYHMNKEKWITIILDDTIKDEDIIKCIDESHSFTDKPTEWLIPANPKYYDVINCFNDKDTIIWKQSNNNIKINDIIYMYVASPYSAIIYKCKVLEVDVPYNKKNNLKITKVMKIKLIKRFDESKYTLEKLSKYGIKSIRGPRTMPKKLSIEIND